MVEIVSPGFNLGIFKYRVDGVLDVISFSKAR